MQWLGIGSLFSLIVILDQLSKFWILKELTVRRTVTVIPGLFDLQLVFNEGAAFGILAGLPDWPRRIALGGIAIIALVVVARILISSREDSLSQLALTAILGGAVGNLIDRVRFDAVVDFLDFYIGEHHWPTFNIADSCISLGVCALVLQMFFSRHQKAANAEAPSASPS